MSRVKRIRTEDPKAAEVVTSHIDESARGILGFSLVEEWEEENGRDLFETAEDILPTVEREFSRSYSQ